MEGKIPTIEITPIPKPRMTQSDKWKKRPCVVRYHKYKDDLKKANPKVDWECLELIFFIPMPKSWSNKKKELMEYQPHKQTPDLDNLIKGFQDALLGDDSSIWHYSSIKKVWGKKGMILYK